MFGWLRKLFAAPPPPVIAPKELGHLDFGELNPIADSQECPDCGCPDFLEGPSGGISQNIKCAAPRCGSTFNVGIAFGKVIHVERI